MKKHSDINKQKVFVRNIKECDIPYFEQEFKEQCNKHFFFSTKTLKCAICHFKNEKEAEHFISKYNGKNFQKSFIKCEYALKKKSEQTKWLPILYSKKKIIFSNTVQITINKEINSIVILHFLKDLFMKHRKILIDCFDQTNNISKNPNRIAIEPQNEEFTGEEYGQIEVVHEKESSTLEDFVQSIKRHINKKKNKSDKGNVFTHLYTFTIEFTNFQITKTFFRLIKKEDFEIYVKENMKDIEINEDFTFDCEMSICKNDDSKVIIKNLSKSCHIENIQKLFRNIETEVRVHIPRKENRKLAFAIVRFTNSENAKKALLLNNSVLCGNVITIEKLRWNPAESIRENGLSIKEQEEEEEENKIQEDSIMKEETPKEKYEIKENRLKIREEPIEEKKNVVKKEEKKKEKKKEKKREKIEDSNGEKNIKNTTTTATTFTDSTYVEIGEKQTQRKNENDVDEGKTLFISNIPPETTEEEIRNYVIKSISPKYVYIKSCRNNPKKISVFVKLKDKKDADEFLKKIGEYEEESEEDEEENVIKKFNKMKKKKEKMKNILLKNTNKNNVQSEHLFFKNTYLFIKRAVRRNQVNAFTKDDEIMPTATSKKMKRDMKKQKKRLDNNIHLINDNDINTENVDEMIKQRNEKLMEKKREILKNRNFLINPTRIYIRNYPSSLEQNTFRQLVSKHFTPILMNKLKLSKKEAFKHANKIITKVKIMKDTKVDLKNEKSVQKTLNKRNSICFVDLSKHEHARELMRLLQNRNIYDVLNKVVYKNQYEAIQRRKDIAYVDYCIEDIRMLHIKKLREEKFQNHLKEKAKNEPNKDSVVKTIKKKEKKRSRGKRQREKRRLLKMQQESGNSSNILQHVLNAQKQGDLPKKEADKKTAVNPDKNTKSNKEKKIKKKGNPSSIKKIKKKEIDKTMNSTKEKTKKKNPKQKKSSNMESIKKGVLKILKEGGIA